MTDKTVNDLADLKKVTTATQDDAATTSEKTEAKSGETETAAIPARVVKKDALGRSYGTGRRKDAVARVWVKAGSGKIIINGKEQALYFKRKTQQLIINQPFLVANQVSRFDVMATVKGGGLSGQAGAVRHGICRAMVEFDPELHLPLKKAGFMTRDSRTVEPKKIGKHKARRTKQWAKR